MQSPYGLEIVENCQSCKLLTGRVFCDLLRPNLNALQSLGFTIVCPKGTVIIAEGQPAEEIAVLCMGHVKVSMASETGKRVCVGIESPGTVLGMSAAIAGTPNQVLIEAFEPCQLRIIKTDRFLAFLRKDSLACLAAVASLSNDVRKLSSWVRLIGLSHTATQKLAQVLIRWDMHEDDEPKGKPHLRFPLTHKELAEIVGVSRETVTRLLSRFEQRDLIQYRGTTLVIEDERTLRALAARTT